VKNSQACVRFKAWAAEVGLDVTPRGSPDFWLFESGKVYAVKIRSRRKRPVRVDRRRALAALQKLGVEVLCWAADDERLVKVEL
jgi:hypothetical protein